MQLLDQMTFLKTDLASPYVFFESSEGCPPPFQEVRLQFDVERTATWKEGADRPSQLCLGVDDNDPDAYQVFRMGRSAAQRGSFQ